MKLSVSLLFFYAGIILKSYVPWANLRRVLGIFPHYSRWVANFFNKIGPLVNCKLFPVSLEVAKAFELSKLEISKSVVSCIDENDSFTVETDAL